MKAMFVYLPTLRVTSHPIRFGSQNGEWATVTGMMEATFSKPMPIGNGKFIQPTGKSFKRPMATIGHWRNGVMIEESLFWDNEEIKKRMGISK